MTNKRTYVRAYIQTHIMVYIHTCIHTYKHTLHVPSIPPVTTQCLKALEFALLPALPLPLPPSENTHDIWP